MVDFHTHIIYEMDDGAHDLETSLALIDSLEKQGVRNIVLTPHYYFELSMSDNFLRQRDQRIEVLRREIAGRDINLYAAAEVRLTTHTNLDLLPGLVVENTRYILVELPYETEIKSALLAKLDQLIDYYGLVPIIAHPERYVYCKQNPEILKYFIMQGCLLQVNLSSLFQSQHKQLACAMIQKGYAHVIGTDCHNMDTRPPLYEQGIKRIANYFGKDVVTKLARNMDKLIKNQSLTVPIVDPLRKILWRYR